MGVIKNLLNKVEELMNRIKILEGKLNKLKIIVDLINTKPKQLPDRSTYKPQQPYLGREGEGLDLEVVIEELLTDGDLSILDEFPNITSDQIEIIEEARGANDEGKDPDEIIRKLKFKKRPPYAIYYPDEDEE